MLTGKRRGAMGITAVSLLLTLGLGHASLAASPAEIWDPASGEFSPTGSAAVERFSHVATRLADGRVLVLGGGDADTTDSLATAEMWDPASGKFTPAASLARARALPTLTALPDGRLLVSGGVDRSAGEESHLASVEMWDPASAAFSAAGELVAARAGHSATLLDDGRVLIAGGFIRFGDDSARVSWAEMLDPGTGDSVPVERMQIARAEHVAIPLSDGTVAVIGGNEEAPAEIWDPSTERFELSGSMSYERRYGFTASSLPDGRVLIAGGLGRDAAPYIAETWRPDTGAFGAATLLTEPRFKHTATVLPDGRVLIAGGRGEDGKLASAEVWDPDSGTLEPTGSMTQPRSHHTATLLDDGRVLIVGGA